jgi:trehalose 6-phosphate phosphatase
MPLSLDLHRSAIQLDIDGTLLEIAPTPHEVVVPPSLPETLARLQRLTGGALALVSGRLIADIDLVFRPLELSAVGGHGAEIRVISEGQAVRHGAPALDAELRQRFRALADDPRIIVEDKAYSIALHYRQAPEKQEAIWRGIEAIRAGLPAGLVEVLPGKSVFEIKRVGFNKGTGIRELMRHAPFTGRQPVFVGDDTTDEAGFAVMPDFDGHALSVGRIVAGTVECFDNPAEVRAWLDELSRQAEPAQQTV